MYRSYQQRVTDALNPTARRLYEVMSVKQSNLAVAADFTQAADLLAFADLIGPEICILKTHIDIVSDFSWSLVEQLRILAHQHQFLLFEDRKFADIGHTVQLQYTQGVYHIAEWAALTNAHIVAGEGTIEGLKAPGLKYGNGLLLLASMSSQGTLTTPSYAQTALRLAQFHKDFVIGFIAQHALEASSAWLYLTPGISLEAKQDQLGQQYITPEQAIIERGSDIIIVGRSIYQSSNPLATARKYRQLAWQAYQQRCG